MRTLTFPLVMAVALTLAVGPAAWAHDESDDGGLLPIQQGSWYHQHGEVDGHLPPVRRNIKIVGKLDLFAGSEHPGRIADVAAYGNYAYLGAFREPDCEEGGVYVIDIADPRNPQEVAFIPASPFTYVGEGVQVVDVNTASFDGQVLIHNNENCIPVDGALPAGRGGASLWDVTDPRNPVPLAEHVGDNDPAVQGSLPHTSLPHQSHSAFGWQQGDRAYMVMVDNAELGNVGVGTDIDIFDITDPRNPTLVVETGLPDFPQIQEDPAPNGNNVFLHDMVVKKIGTRYYLLGSYWDGGYIVLDVTGLPNGKKPKLIGHTDFGRVEPFRRQMGLPIGWTPEGNAHQAEFSYNNRFILAADEDFGPYRVTGLIKAGKYAGAAFSATQGSNVPQVNEDNPLDGPVTFVGDACTPLLPAPSPEHIALIERGTCTFTIKTQTAQAAGYAAGIVFNDQQGGTGCEAQVFMLAVGDIPFMFVARSTGLQILEQDFDNPCTATTPLPGTPASDISLSAIFDGWGYVHLYDAKTFKRLAHWALPEAIDPQHAQGSGIMSVHEVATDPTQNLAYVSHYGGGVRVLHFNSRRIKEVGAFIAKGGSNFWGVEVHYLPGRRSPLILASDRDAGLWILRYKP